MYTIDANLTSNLYYTLHRHLRLDHEQGDVPLFQHFRDRGPLCHSFRR
jgi:hypothetical protein